MPGDVVMNQLRSPMVSLINNHLKVANFIKQDKSRNVARVNRLIYSTSVNLVTDVFIPQLAALTDTSSRIHSGNG